MRKARNNDKELNTTVQLSEVRDGYRPRAGCVLIDWCTLKDLVHIDPAGRATGVSIRREKNGSGCVSDYT